MSAVRTVDLSDDAEDAMLDMIAPTHDDLDANDAAQEAHALRAEHEANVARTEFTIPVTNLDQFHAAIDKISRRAIKLGLGPIRPVETARVMKDRSTTLPGGRKSKTAFECAIIHLDAAPVRVQGWRFVACLDHSSEVGNIIRSVPNAAVEIHPDYRTAKPTCDHCGVKRNRNDTYLLCDDAGAFKQVGRSCLADFFGYDPKAIARMAEYLASAGEIAGAAEDEEYGLGGGGGRGGYLMMDFLADCAREIRENGFVSGGRARAEGGESTRHRVWINLTERDPRKRRYAQTVDFEMAASALEWAQALRDRPDLSNDYLHNCSVVAHNAVVRDREQGIVASFIEAFKRDQAREEQRRQAEANAPQIEIADMTGILALFDKARQNGLKNPKVRLSVGEGGHEIVLSQAGERSTHQGSINVKSPGSFESADWYGRINKDGTFTASRSRIAPQGTAELLTRFAAEPDEVASEFGRLTMSCCYCNKALTKAEAASVGYGKACAKRWGRPFPTPEKKPRAKKVTATEG